MLRSELKRHTITVRLNDKEFNILKELKAFKEELQKEENIEYSYSDLLRIALGYMYDIEIKQLYKYNKRTYRI